jgi:ribokinase
MVGCLGDDGFGQDFRDWLSKERIDATGVASTRDAGTGVGLPVVDDSGQNAIVIVPQANLSVDAGVILQHRATISSAKIVLLQLEIPDEANLEAARLARVSGATVILNPAPFRPISSELLGLVDMIVPNEHELQQLGASIGAGSGPVVEVSEAIRAALEVDLVVTLGADGALVIDASGTTRVAGMKVSAIDTVGAGDTFAGNLAANLARRVPLRQAVVRANAAAALSVTKVGGAASTPTAEEINRFVQELEN